MKLLSEGDFYEFSPFTVTSFSAGPNWNNLSDFEICKTRLNIWSIWSLSSFLNHRYSYWNKNRYFPKCCIIDLFFECHSCRFIHWLHIFLFLRWSHIVGWIFWCVYLEDSDFISFKRNNFSIDIQFSIRLNWKGICSTGCIVGRSTISSCWSIRAGNKKYTTREEDWKDWCFHRK